jgi:DNA-binding protein HU-beta
MNKKELLIEMAKISSLTKSDCNKVLDAFIQAVMKAIKSKKYVRLVGFGTFYSLARKASEGFNPKTRARIKIPASNRPKFRAGKQFIKTIN